MAAKKKDFAHLDCSRILACGNATNNELKILKPVFKFGGISSTQNPISPLLYGKSVRYNQKKPEICIPKVLGTFTSSECK